MADFQSVKAAAREYVENSGHISSSADLAYRLAPDFGGISTYFMRQVYRALEQLAAEDVLVRNPPGEGDPNYRTPEYDQIARRSAQLAADADAAERKRWAAIHDALTDRGFSPVPVPNVTLSRARGLPVTLEPGEWEQLLTTSRGMPRPMKEAPGG